MSAFCVGDLDAVVSLGYPGSRASLQQQFGRAGRRGGHSLGIMVCYDSPVDAYLQQIDLLEFDAGFAVCFADVLSVRCLID